ncbi:MAG: CrcB protein [Phycisphaerales bacterium]|jgi:CrcB protein
MGLWDHSGGATRYPVHMLNLALVFLGGGTGAALRYLASIGTAAALRPWTHSDEGVAHADALLGLLPLATLLVNITGCFLIGLAIPSLTERDDLRHLLIVGLLGGFTTFSAFGHETVALHHAHHNALAVLYVLLSVFLGAAAVLLGNALMGRGSP